jgi:tRNA pseudouridine32 synthase/23S rRNA pseudouridine746 synthase
MSPSIAYRADRPRDKLDILLEDDAFLALNKPSGLLAVPGRGPLAHDSLAQRVQACHPDALVVHRLDMATSGVMLMARGAHWQRVFSRLFAERNVHKHYVAVVSGLLAHDAGEIDLPLITDWPHRPRQKIDPVAGKPSLTHYRVLMRDNSLGITRVELQPVTGRSHQLRVHMQALGHPILGDALYAPAHVQEQAPRLLLHARALAFDHPAHGARVGIECTVPF